MTNVPMEVEGVLKKEKQEGGYLPSWNTWMYPLVGGVPYLPRDVYITILIEYAPYLLTML